MLSTNIWLLRTLHGLSKAEVARKMGVDPSTVGRWEEGAEPGAKTLRRLADVIGCRHDDFFVDVFTVKIGADGRIDAEGSHSQVLIGRSRTIDEALLAAAH